MVPFSSTYELKWIHSLQKETYRPRNEHREQDGLPGANPRVWRADEEGDVHSRVYQAEGADCSARKGERRTPPEDKGSKLLPNVDIVVSI